MRRFVVLVLGLALATGAAHALLHAREVSSPMRGMRGPGIGEITVEGALAPADEELVGWATDRFREAGLSLPRVHVSFHNDTRPCEGARGGHQVENGVSRVLICVSQLGPSRELRLKRTLLHEFAHAWDTHFPTQDVREKFLELLGLEGWSFEVPYEKRASEHAAETITWGLIDEPLLFGSLHGATPWHVQYERYLTLTGIEPPHGYVWSLFAASHDIYAHTPEQLEAVETASDLSEESGRRAEWIEVRFSRTSSPCGGQVTLSELNENKLRVQVCPRPHTDIAEELLDEFTDK